MSIHVEHALDRSERPISAIVHSLLGDYWVTSQKHSHQPIFEGLHIIFHHQPCILWPFQGVKKLTSLKRILKGSCKEPQCNLLARNLIHHIIHTLPTITYIGTHAQEKAMKQIEPHPKTGITRILSNESRS